MRTSEFTFKKTKRVKVVTEHAGISIDLTRQEAEGLADIMVAGADEVEVEVNEDPVGEALYELLNRLKAFAAGGK